MASNVKRNVAQATLEAPVSEPVVEKVAQAKPKKQLSSLVNYLATAAELQGLDNALTSTLAAVDVIVDGDIVGFDETRNALRKMPQFRGYFIEEETKRVMSDDKVQELMTLLKEAKSTLEERTEALKSTVEEISGNLLTFGPAGIQPVAEATAYAAGTKGKRYNPRLDKYTWSVHGSQVVLEREGQIWKCSVDGVEYARDASFTKAVERTYSSAFGLTSSMSVPRIAKMREQEAAAGLID